MSDQKPEHHADYMYREWKWKVPVLYAKTDAKAMDTKHYMDVMREMGVKDEWMGRYRC